MGVENEPVPAQPTPEELRLRARIAIMAQDPGAEARARIMAAVRTAPMPGTAPSRRIAMGHRLRMALVGFGASGLLFGATAGALAASSGALPSSPAYGLRHIEENLRVAVADQREKPRLRLRFAAEKLSQAREQARRGDVSDAARLLSDAKLDLEQAQAELHDVNNPSEVQSLSAERTRLQTDAAVEQHQVETIANGGTVAPPNSPSSATPGDDSDVPAPEVRVTPPTELPAPPDNSSAGSPDSTPAP
jgi:gas vesicle protein